MLSVFDPDPLEPSGLDQVTRERFGQRLSGDLLDHLAEDPVVQVVVDPVAEGAMSRSIGVNLGDRVGDGPALVEVLSGRSPQHADAVDWEATAHCEHLTHRRSPGVERDGP